MLERHKLWIDEKGGKCANLEYANLEGADLYCANLTGAKLTGADLTDADLRGADLRGAYLTRANLMGANLTGSNLTGSNLTGASLRGADLRGADLRGAKLNGANLTGANLTGAKDLPDISWIIPGCLVQLNKNMYGFYLAKENKWDNFVQDSFGFFIQNNVAERTFDMLAGDRIIRNIPDWVKYTGLKQILADSKDKTND